MRRSSPSSLGSALKSRDAAIVLDDDLAIDERCLTPKRRRLGEQRCVPLSPVMAVSGEGPAVGTVDRELGAVVLTVIRRALPNKIAPAEAC